MHGLAALFPLALILAGCGGRAAPCPPLQMLSPVGYAAPGGPTSIFGSVPTANQPYPANATAIYFSTSNVQPLPGNNPPFDIVQGSPIYFGSDGSQVVGGSIQPLGKQLEGYASTVSGLEPNVTYTVRFTNLVGSPSGCGYGVQSAGSFTTTASTRT